MNDKLEKEYDTLGYEDMYNIDRFITALKRGHIGWQGITPKLLMLIERFGWYEKRLGVNRVWLEIYGELAELLENVKENGFNFSIPLPKNDPREIKGKMNDDGTYNPPYLLKKGKTK